MKKLLQPLRWALPALLLGGFGANAQGLNYSPAGASAVAGTYADLGTTGTAIATANNDDASSTAQNIGFTFGFNGASFTQFVLNTNGFLKLGATAPSADNLYLPITAAPNTDPFQSTNPADVNLIAPFNLDLVAGNGAGGAEYRVALSGSSPNRVCTIQWKNLSDKAGTTPSQLANVSFQVRLFETTNQVEFVYNTAVASAAAPAFRFSQVGLKGSGFASGQFVQAVKQSGGAWTAATFASALTGTALNTLNYRNSVLPVAGTTYRFAPTVLANNDAAVTALYTLGKVSSTYGSPHVVQAVVNNPGAVALTNKVVTLTVTGATTFTNTQTIAALAPGATTTVSFAGYPVTGTSGTNTVTVTVPADDVATNNTQTATQLVTADEMSYIQGTTYVGGAGIAAANAVLAVRYTAVTAGSLNTVTTNFNAAVAAATYQVVVYDAAGAGGTPGAILYTSPTRPRPAAGGDDVVTIPGTAIPAGNFFVGIKAITATNLAVSYQTEIPLRSGVFLYTTTGGTTWVDVNTTPLNSRLAVNVAFGTPSTCPPLTSLTATGVSNTGATLNFTAGASATSYTITVTPQGGTTTTQPAAASPVTLSGLTPGTRYTVSVVANCGAGQTSTATTVTFTTTGGGSGVSFGGVCGLALPIPDFTGGVPGTVSYPIVVSGVSGTLQTVDFIITHTFDGDLIISLTSPAGQTVVLSNRRGGGGDNFGDATNCPTAVTSLSDANTATLTAGTAPFTGPFAPDNPLTGFSGTPNGTWTFTVTDNAGADVGTLDYVKLTFSGPATCNPVTGLTAVSGNNGTRATVNFTPAASATSYTVTYQQVPGGTPTTVPTNPTTSPVIINGLTGNTTYLITVVSNCAGGLTSSSATTTVRTVTAAREALGNGSLSVFPNPASKAFTLALPALAGERTATVVLLNALGQSVYSRNVELNAAGTQARVDVSSLAKGIYTLRVQTSSQTATKSVVVE